MSLTRKPSVLSIKDKNEDPDDIVFQVICKIVVSRLNVVFLIYSVLLDFAIRYTNILIFDYPDPRLSGLFRVVPTSPDNRGSTVLLYNYRFICFLPLCMA